MKSGKEALTDRKCNHLDCINFTPIDVAKGFCNYHDANIILIDSDVCPVFTAAQKCKFCSNLTEIDERGIGTCVGYPVKDWAYEELRATHCDKFAAK